jgi:hypothetical protein
MRAHLSAQFPHTLTVSDDDRRANRHANANETFRAEGIEENVVAEVG